MSKTEKYYLLDLARTVKWGTPYFWKLSRKGYTTYIENAGLFPEEIALQIVKEDFDALTVMIRKSTINNFFDWMEGRKCY